MFTATVNGWRDAACRMMIPREHADPYPGADDRVAADGAKQKLGNEIQQLNRSNNPAEIKRQSPAQQAIHANAGSRALSEVAANQLRGNPR